MSLLRSAAIACALGMLVPHAGAEPAVIALARAYLGPDSTLDSVASIHLVGTYERVDPSDASPLPVHGELEVFFARPLRQRISIKTLKTKETTVLDGYDAWALLENNLDPSKFRLTWLSTAALRALRANTAESIFFYRGVDGVDQVSDMGREVVDQVPCEHVDFDHGDGIVYQRFFDRDTGRLVLTRRGAETFRESGEIMAGGIRFPRMIVSTTRTASGKEIVSTAVFTRVEVNVPVDPALFAVPDVVRKHDGVAPITKP